MIKICKSNKNYKELSKALKDNNMEFKHKKCLSKCGLCHKQPFAKIHGEFISAENVEKLIKELSKNK